MSEDPRNDNNAETDALTQAFETFAVWFLVSVVVGGVIGWVVWQFM